MKTTIERTNNSVTARMNNGIIINVSITGNWNNYCLNLEVLDSGTVITDKQVSYDIVTKKEAQKEMTQIYRQAIKEYK